MNVVVYRAVKPAAKVMDSLRFPQKLLLIGLVFLVPMLGISALLLKTLSAELAFTSLERQGAAVLAPLLELQTAVQNHRGKTTLLLNHVEGETNDLPAINEKADTAIAAIEAWRAGDGRSFKTDERWKAIVATWSDLEKRDLNDDPARNFKDHSDLVQNIIDFTGATADASNLSIDLELASHVLVDLVTVRAPVALKQIGDFRNYVSSHVHAGTTLTPSTLARVMVLETAMDNSFDPIPAALQRSLEADAAVAAALTEKLKAAVVAENGLKKLVEDNVVGSDTVSVGDKEIFAAGATAKQTVADLDRAAMSELGRLLDKRLSRLRHQRTIAVSACLVAALLALYLFLGFMRSMAATLRGLRRAAVKMTGNEFPDEIDLFSTDEMQEIANELEKISLAFRNYSEEQKRQLNDATKRATAMINCSVGIMIANNDGIIEFVNSAGVAMFERATEAVRKLDPEFDAHKLVGRPFDIFHHNAKRQRDLLATLQQPFQTRVRIGPGAYDIAVTPVFDQAGVRLGAVIEWIDRTAQVAMDGKVAEIVLGASDGDFSRRVSLDGLEPNFHARAHNLNKLLDIMESGLLEVDRVLGAVTEGDLTPKITREFKGLFARLAAHTNATVAELAQIVGQIKGAADNVKVASREIAAGNSDLSTRTEQQAAHIEETASSMEQLTSTVRRKAENADQASRLAQGASDVAVKGGEVVAQVVANMRAIEESSRKVADIVSVIDGISFQTNILALNAAVKAARAGEQGRGFAVVASEVRSLAHRAAGAAKEIKALITDSVEKVGHGSTLVGTAGNTMDEIVTGIKRVTGIMNEISSASREQSQGIEQVNAAITQMDEATQQNAALVEQASASAHSLEDQAVALASAVAVFRTSGGTEPAVAVRPPARVPVAKTVPAAPAKPLAVVRSAQRPKRGADSALARKAPSVATSKSAERLDDNAWQEF
ncbi:MAG: methyl-accepting chemotaxis protein [Nevskia sp.]|nr:methyl-accepting chemotaxis protein [Nevskia sp.]